MKKAIVTGANGFIGSAVIKKLLQEGIEIIALGREENRKNIPSDIRFIPFNLEDSFSILNNIDDRDIDVFYHFAWNGASGEARANVDLQLENVRWTVQCLELAKQIGCKRFVCSGSIMENETYYACLEQENRPGLGYIYGSGKLVAHTMCMSVAANIGIELVWAKITNAYGPGEISPRMINTTIRKIINNDPLLFTSGTQNYDFVYIDDVAEAFYLIAKNGKPFCNYLIGSSQAKTLRAFLEEMQASIALDQTFVFGDIPFTGVNMPINDFDCSLTEEHTGFRAKTSFADGVRKTMEWIKEYDQYDTKI